MMASCIKPIPPMRADWTASGACTSGSTAHPRGATRRASGGAAATSTTSAERRRDLQNISYLGYAEPMTTTQITQPTGRSLMSAGPRISPVGADTAEGALKEIVGV